MMTARDCFLISGTITPLKASFINFTQFLFPFCLRKNRNLLKPLVVAAAVVFTQFDSS